MVASYQAFQACTKVSIAVILTQLHLWGEFFNLCNEGLMIAGPNRLVHKSVAIS